jgi:uncharacterized phage protein (TIGR01671 family)
MREIKFRGIEKYHFARDEDRPKTMLYGTSLVQDSVNTWLIDNPSRKSLALGMTKTIIEPDTVGQYTGLKDRNGQEVFEGDIIESEPREGIYTRKTLYEITYDAIYCSYVGVFIKCLEGLVEAENQPLGELRFKAVIIGNIHENPELLK